MLYCDEYDKDCSEVTSESFVMYIMMQNKTKI